MDERVVCVLLRAGISSVAYRDSFVLGHARFKEELEAGEVILRCCFCFCSGAWRVGEVVECVERCDGEGAISSTEALRLD